MRTQIEGGAQIAFGGQQGFDITTVPSAQYLLQVVLALYVPYTFVSPLIGVFIDRFERRDGEWAIAYRELLRDWANIDETPDMDDLSSFTSTRAFLGRAATWTVERVGGGSAM